MQPLTKNYSIKEYKAILSRMIKIWFNPFPAFLEHMKQDCECTCIITTHAFNKYCTVSMSLSKWQMATIYFHFNLILSTPAWEFLQSIDNLSFTNVMWLVTFFCIHFDVSTAYIYKTYVQWWTVKHNYQVTCNRVSHSFYTA
jgi:hypothetical protein